MKYLIALILAIALNAHAFDPKKDKVQVIDQWQCQKELCVIGLHEDGRILLIIVDKKGVVSASHHGKLVYIRDGA